ncbi:MAG: class I SAM-dependent methyltransferase [Bacteroidia bacterium]|nr:class I SAM-dependent methyltransferase [Bacteroidia bacterium]
MYNPFQLALKFAGYYLRSVNLHGLHSPFAYKLTEDVLYNKAPFYCYTPIEKIRQSLLEDKRHIQVLDLGAGSNFGNTKEKAISQIAKRAAKPAKYGQVIFRLANYLQPKTVVELGTSLGMTTAYLASANSQSKIISLEGCPETARIAGENFKKLGLKNIELRVGDFKDTLPPLSRELETVDLAFFDGNHRYQPTMDYFNQFLPLANEDSLFIFDDVHWSEEMEKAWEEIKKHPKVSMTIDLFFIGLVFFRKGKEKEDLVVRY